MASLKILKATAKGTVSTSDGVTWTTLASYTLASNASFSIRNIIALGKDGSGNTAEVQGTQRGKRVSGTITMVGSLVDLVTALVGSDVVLNTSAYRININGDIIELQVKGVALTNIDWIGSFDIMIH
jgi:hypothetical protein